MVKGLHSQNLPGDVSHVVDQLERHCLAPDGSLISKPLFNDLQLAREEMCRERLRYLEAMAIYSEAIAMVEEYHQAISVSSIGGMRDTGGLYPQFGLRNSPQVYQTLEHQMIVAEAAQRLRLPLISKDGEVHDEEIEKLSVVSRSSLDSNNSSSLSSSNYATPNSSVSGVNYSLASMDQVDPVVGGVPSRFLGITPAYLWQTQHLKTPLSVDMTEYRMSLSREVDARLKMKCDKLSDAFVLEDNESPSFGSQSSTSRLPERVKLLIEEIEREEAELRDDLYSADRKFAEYYSVLEQILGVLFKLVKDLKLDRQHKYDEMQKTWFCKRCQTMSAKLSVLENVLLLGTYTKESIAALHKIRKYLVEATEEASIAYNKAVTRLREYQGVDPHFDDIARQYQDIVKKLENMQWTIDQVEMDLKRMSDNSTS
ncbi:AUGMIN subunit 4-like [Vicia villosa]|uniref:AUGMIN subunit 4-like n=1 Tax=Vicia villosa TaxID=3911 RepID=UPI00273AC945|nr:AUGMIN subunit 4-like [Vicia villosa]